jgi:hypothetical protein
VPPPKRKATNGPPGDPKPKRPMMSVNPPVEVTASVGAYRTVALTQAIRVVAHLLGDAAVRVASAFTPPEWGVIARSFQGRQVEPEHPMPGHSLARIVERSHHHYRTGSSLGKGADQAVEKVVARLEKLEYLDAWAVIIACQFYWDRQDQLESEPDFKWWELPQRRELIERRPGGNSE